MKKHFFVFGGREHVFSNATKISTASDAADLTRPSYQAYQILRIGFTIAPIAMGLDKYFNFLVDWDKYIPPFVSNLMGGNGNGLMYIVGAVEIAAGVGVLIKPKIFAYIVAIWLFLIIVNLLMIPGFFDVALRNFGLMLGALALGRLSQEYSD